MSWRGHEPDPGPPVKVVATEAHRILRSKLGPWAKAHGFRRAPNANGWTKSIETKFLHISVQISRYGWDQNLGSKFVVEFEMSNRPEANWTLNRARMATLLTDEEREDLRSIQNDSILGMRRPSSAPFDGAPEFIATYFQSFDLVTEPYGPDEDVWLIYTRPRDLERWADFIVEKLPSVLDRFAPGWKEDDQPKMWSSLGTSLRVKELSVDIRTPPDKAGRALQSGSRVTVVTFWKSPAGLLPLQVKAILDLSPRDAVMPGTEVPAKLVFRGEPAMQISATGPEVGHKLALRIGNRQVADALITKVVRVGPAGRAVKPGAKPSQG